MAADNKSEKPTARRKQKARDQGQIARSRDLPAALGMLAVTLALAWQPHAWVSRWHTLFERMLAMGTQVDFSGGIAILTSTAIALAQWSGPLLLLAFCVSVGAFGLQGGFVFATEAFKFNPARLNPATNLGQIVSLSGFSRLLRSLLPGSAILFLAYSLLERSWPLMVRLPRLTSKALMVTLFGLLFELAWKCCLVLVVWSAADYGFQWWNQERRLRMTKQEVKEELKDVDGNPATRGRMRRLRRSMLRKIMARDVARATAVVTNPTHYAVAIEYRPESMHAPVVVAKGRNLLAQRIKQLARWHEVPIVENPPLAQALYKTTEVGQAIPPKLYSAVAEILAFLYRAQTRKQTATG